MRRIPCLAALLALAACKPATQGDANASGPAPAAANPAAPGNSAAERPRPAAPTPGAERRYDGVMTIATGSFALIVRPGPGAAAQAYTLRFGDDALNECLLRMARRAGPLDVDVSLLGRPADAGHATGGNYAAFGGRILVTRFLSGNPCP